MVCATSSVGRHVVFVSFSCKNLREECSEFYRTTGQIKLRKKAWYVQNSSEILDTYRKKYLANADDKKQAERERYASQPEFKRKNERE